ncbi:hypothetical protein [Sulfitobacter sp. SK011]|uniref:hypothetical protein n=1 Tax=Sulfitobacter sp. SK011 TaxID=1389004 RepID=UPI000E0C1CB0|nr:hypothetical protein [Sulfitobacter sp. SK011]AXI42970.1 hypothetical protein C1J02_14300 [Sulfitobacter sp. SK011]
MLHLTRRSAVAGLGLALAGAGAVAWQSRPDVSTEKARALYAQPLTKPAGALKVFHLGHSLVGRDMPAMLAQLAGPEHTYKSQLGWGTSLKQHWEPDEVINGFAEENNHPHFRAAKQAIGSGAFDAVVVTEMVEIADAIRYHDAATYLARWAGLAWDANPRTRIYLYETWHHTDDGNGWLTRIDGDLRKYWLGQVKYPALTRTDAPIHLIPAGQVMAAFVRAAQASGGTPGITTLHDLFATQDDGTPDTIHFNDLGAYLVALTHFAVLYHRNPVGLPYALLRADGTNAHAPDPQTAQLMQQVVWDVIQRHPETGVAA